MNEIDARNALGLKARENPCPRLAEFEGNLKRKQGFVENSPSPETKARYQKELDEYEQAFEVIVDIGDSQTNRRNTQLLVIMILLIMIGVVAWLGYDHYQNELAVESAQLKQEQQLQLAREHQFQIDELYEKGCIAAEKRKWKQAEDAFSAIQIIDPESSLALEGVESIRVGKLEELNQKIFYTLGNSQAALEAGRWEEARALALSVLQQNPGHPEASAKLKKIENQRRVQEVAMKLQMTSKALDSGKLNVAEKSLREVKKLAPQHVGIVDLSQRLASARAKIQAQREKAKELLKQASLLDAGQYSPQAITLLDEAKRLDPTNRKIQLLYEKMSNYTRTIEVPAGIATISEAVANARPRDRIRIAPGTYKESITIVTPIRLEGSPDGKTIIELPADQAALVTITATGKGAHLSHLTLNHAGFDLDEDRSSALIVQGGSATIDSCKINRAAGHGIAVIDGAQVTIAGCEISDSGWDGVSVYGQGSRADIRDTYSQNNLQHGVEFWEGGSGRVSNSRILGNGLCGILAMSPATGVSIQTTLCARNRGAGILISDQVTAEVIANRCDKNLLSGIVARGVGTTVSVTRCVTTNNGEAGILIHKGVQRKVFNLNQSTSNNLRQVWLDAAVGK